MASSLMVAQTKSAQVPTYFGALSAEATDGGCATGSGGVFITVHFQVLDQYGSSMQVSGVTPQEHVTVNGTPAFPGFRSFATPPTTVVDGKFDDDPVGTCYPPNTSGNPCVTVVQPFQALYSGTAYPISTTTSRRDCNLGVQDAISGNPQTYNKTFTQGTVN